MKHLLSLMILILGLLLPTVAHAQTQGCTVIFPATDITHGTGYVVSYSVPRDAPTGTPADNQCRQLLRFNPGTYLASAPPETPSGNDDFGPLSIGRTLFAVNVAPGVMMSVWDLTSLANDYGWQPTSCCTAFVDAARAGQ